MMRSKLDKEHFEDKRILPKIYGRTQERANPHGGETHHKHFTDAEGNLSRDAVKVLCLEDGVDLLVTGCLTGKCEGAVLLHLRGSPQKGPKCGA